MVSWVIKLLREVKSFEMSWYVLICSMYIMWPKHIKPWKLPAMLGCIMVVCMLTHCALLQSVCDLTGEQMNMQYSLIQELMLYKFERGHNDMEEIKKYCPKVEGTLLTTITRCFKKFLKICFFFKIFPFLKICFFFKIFKNLFLF